MSTAQIISLVVGVGCIGYILILIGRMAEMRRADRERQAKHEFEMAVFQEARKRRGGGGAK